MFCKKESFSKYGSIYASWNKPPPYLVDYSNLFKSQFLFLFKIKTGLHEFKCTLLSQKIKFIFESRD